MTGRIDISYLGCGLKRHRLLTTEYGQSCKPYVKYFKMIDASIEVMESENVKDEG